MPQSFDKPTIIRLLTELGRNDRRRLLFGSKAHDYKLNPPIELSTIEQFEARHGIRLPDDYRRFITEIGNGGVGPNDGLLPFGGAEEGRSWEESDLIGDVSQPFPHIEAWNLPAAFWEQFPDISPDTPPEEEEKLLADWDKLEFEHYFNPAIMNGAIPICDRGCGLLQWLVVHGEQKGFVWDDFRADRGGIRPLRDESGKQVMFSDWYMTWLSDSLNQAVQQRRRKVMSSVGLIVAAPVLALVMMAWALLPALPRVLTALGLLICLAIGLRKRPRDLLTLLGLIVVALVFALAIVLLGNTLSLVLLWAVVLFGVVKAWLHG
jgi:hypothetical protein